MKILFTTDTIQRGGKERQLFILASALLAKGNEVHVVTLRRGADNFLDEYGFNPEKLTLLNSKNILNRCSEASEIFKALTPDIVFAWDMQTAILSLVSYKKVGFIFINGSIQHGVRLFSGSNLLRSLICHLSPYVVANSRAGLRANNLKPGSRRFVLYNGIEDKFRGKLNVNDIDKKRQEMIPGYLDKSGEVFISVANFVPFKDYFTVLKALKKYGKAHRFYYIILGEGPMRREIEREVTRLGLKENVILAGRVENVLDYLQIGDCLIHSSRGEGVSNAILEAMFAGLPIIASRVGGVPETAYPGSSQLFPYKNDEALYQCLLKSEKLRISFDPSTSAYKKHLDQFSVKTMVAGFENILSEIVSSRQGHDRKTSVTKR